MNAATIPDHAISDALAILLKNLHLLAGEHRFSTRDIKKDLTIFQQLELQDKMMELVLTIFTNNIKHRISTIRRQRNHFSPIHRLPVEIIACIFELVVESQSKHKVSYFCSSDIATVCSLWRQVALSTPRLWIYLDTQLSGPIISLSIERSRNVPLNIIIEGAEPGAEEREALFLDMVVPYLSRWETLECSSDISCGLMLPHLEKKTLPLLKTFDVISYPDESLPMPHAVSHNAPRLQVLNIFPYSFPLGSPVISSLLRSLKLRPVIGETRLLPEQWQSFLSCTPELEFLHVGALNMAGVVSQAVVPFQASLPRLKTLELDNLPVSTIGLLLSSISSNEDTPPLVHIAYPWTDDHAEDACVTMFPRTVTKATLLTSIRTMTSISADCSAGVILTAKAGIEAHRDILKYRSEDDVAPVSELWNALILPHVLPQLRSIDLNGSQIFNNDDFSSDLRECISLERFFIRRPDPPGQTYNLLDLCSKLSSRGHPTRPSNVNVSFAWPWPNLRCLGIAAKSTSLPCIADMVRVRYGARYQSDAEIIAGLEELRLTGTEDEIGPMEMVHALAITHIKEIMEPLGTVVRFVHGDDFDQTD